MRRVLRPATFAFWSPFVGIAVLFVFVASIGDRSELPASTPFVVAISAAVWIFGLAFGFRALRENLIVPPKRKLTRVHASIVANILLLAITSLGTFVLLRLYTQLQRDQSLAAEQEAQKLRTTLTNEASVQLELAKRATIEFIAGARESQRQFEASCRMLTNPPILDFSTVKSRADLQAREEILRDVANASQEMLDSSRNPIERFERELSRRMLDKETRESVLRDFKKRVEPVNSKIVELRQTDLQRIESVQRLVRFMSANWGRWTFDSQADGPQFDDSKLVHEYTKMLNENDRLLVRARNLQAEVTNSFNGR